MYCYIMKRDGIIILEIVQVDLNVADPTELEFHLANGWELLTTVLNEEQSDAFQDLITMFRQWRALGRN